MLIRDNVPEDEQADAVKEVMLRSLLIANMLANGAKSHYDEISLISRTTIYKSMLIMCVRQEISCILAEHRLIAFSRKH